MPDPIHFDASGIDLSSRIVASTTVAASPTAAVETIIASIDVPDTVPLVSGILVVAFAAFTVGTNGVSANLRIRQTDASGTVKAATGALTVTAANLVEANAVAFDTAPASTRVYVATLTVGSASAGSTVSGVGLAAIAV
jgi:uncharacterized membrane protein